MGAERIRPQTIEQFVEAFAGCGFRREALFPCYGLAEATLMVSGGPRQTAPVVLHVKADSLARQQVEIGSTKEATCRVLVGCGENLRGQRILIVDPETRRAVAEGHVGEIWVQGPSVAGGYYESPQATAATFEARLAGGERQGAGGEERGAGSGEQGARYSGLPASGSPPPALGPFLRTGDLGFILRKQLFVTGRLKNLIIIRGRNHYPEDIEQTISSTYEGLRVGCCAAFSIEVEDQDQLVVVQEVEPRKRDLDAGAAIAAIRSAIAIRHELEVYAVVLVKAGSVPKTSSGKTRRAACREQYLCGELEILAAWKTGSDEAESERAESPVVLTPRQVTAEEIEAWLIERITARLRLAPGDVKVTTPFLETRHGLAGRDGDCRRTGALAGTTAISHRDLQLSHDRRLGAVAVQSREG